MDKASTKTIVQNRQVRHDYFILNLTKRGSSCLARKSNPFGQEGPI